VRLNEGKVAEAQIESFEMRLNSARGIMPVAKGSQALRVRRRNGGKVVFARVSTFTGTTEEVDEAIRQVRENVLPRTEQLDGFKGAYFLVDRQNGKSLTVTLWESEEAMRASEEAANDLRSEVADALDTQMVGVERYEVALAAQA
jgi:heme-degrading monooxygenase HmoA